VHQSYPFGDVLPMKQAKIQTNQHPNFQLARHVPCLWLSRARPWNNQKQNQQFLSNAGFDRLSLRKPTKETIVTRTRCFKGLRAMAASTGDHTGHFRHGIDSTLLGIAI
jgi:hypothetical protein